MHSASDMYDLMNTDKYSDEISKTVNTKHKDYTGRPTRNLMQPKMIDKGLISAPGYCYLQALINLKYYERKAKETGSKTTYRIQCGTVWILVDDNKWDFCFGTETEGQISKGNYHYWIVDSDKNIYDIATWAMIGWSIVKFKADDIIKGTRVELAKKGVRYTRVQNKEDKVLIEEQLFNSVANDNHVLARTVRQLYPSHFPPKVDNGFMVVHLC